MLNRRLYVVNESTLVTNDDVHAMIHACNVQLHEHVAPAFRQDRVVITFHAGDLASVQQVVPPGSWVIGLFDDSDQAGALGWHWVDDQDRVFGKVFARPCLEDGASTALTGPYAVSSVLSHEAIETFGDPACNAWSDSGRGYFVATELCDPVEADTYEIDGVAISNFVLPSWFDPQATAPLDYLGKCTAPFSMTPGGYWVQAAVGAETQKFSEVVAWEREVGFEVAELGKGAMVFSSEMPEWRRLLKQANGRNALKRTLTSPA